MKVQSRIGKLEAAVSEAKPKTPKTWEETVQGWREEILARQADCPHSNVTVHITWKDRLIGNDIIRGDGKPVTAHCPSCGYNTAVYKGRSEAVDRLYATAYYRTWGIGFDEIVSNAIDSGEVEYLTAPVDRSLKAVVEADVRRNFPNAWQLHTGIEE